MSSFWYTLAIVIITTKSETKVCTQGQTCSCSNDEACTLQCIGYAQCKGGDTTLQCRPHYPCVIICDSNGNIEACLDAHINGNGATNITLTCTDELSCKAATIDCDTATYCNIECSGSSGCTDTNIDCQSSQCSLDCASQDACSAISIDDGDAVSFQCANTCTGNNIPAPFTTITAQPTVSPSHNPSISPTNNPSIPPTTASPSVPPTTAYPSIPPTYNPSISPSKNPTTYPSVNPSTSPTHNPTNSPTKKPILIIRVTDDLGNVIATKEAIMIITTQQDEGRQGLGNENGNGDGIQLWTLFVITGSAVCCLVIGISMVLLIHRKRKADAGALVMAQHAHKIASNSNIGLNEGNETENLDVFNENSDGFEQGLVNNVVASEIIMDDIVNAMNTQTPGNIDTPTTIEMNRLQEGGDDDMDIASNITPMDMNENEDDEIDEIDEINNNCNVNSNNNDEDVMNDINNGMVTAGDEININITAEGDDIDASMNDNGIDDINSNPMLDEEVIDDIDDMVTQMDDDNNNDIDYQDDDENDNDDIVHDVNTRQ